MRRLRVHDDLFLKIFTDDPLHRLVRLSEKLELDDDEMTPAQGMFEEPPSSTQLGLMSCTAYSAIREAIPSDDFLRPMLEAMKTPLGSLVHCVGIGACMDAPMYVNLLILTPTVEGANIEQVLAAFQRRAPIARGY